MSKLGAVIYAFCLILFGLFCYLAHQSPYFPGDIGTSHYLQGIDIPLFKPIMQATSHWITASTVTLLLFVALWIINKRLEAIFLTSLTAASGLAGWLLKLLISRPRPGSELVQIWAEGWGASFPSGHAALALVFCSFLFYLAPRLVKPKVASGVLRFILTILVLLVGASRIYLGVHWASDVAGGLFLGGLILYPAIILYNNYAKRRGEDA